MSTAAAATVSNGRNPRAPAAPTMMSKRMERTSPRRSMLNPKIDQARRDEYQGPPCRSAGRGSRSLGLRLEKSLDQDPGAKAQQKPA